MNKAKQLYNSDKSMLHYIIVSNVEMRVVRNE